MAEDTNDGQGSSQDEAAGKRIEALEQRVEELTGLLEAAGKVQGGGGGEEQKPDEQNEPDEDEKAKGFLSRLMARFKASDDDDGAEQDKPSDDGKGKPETKPGKSGGEPDKDAPPPWAMALASELRELKEQQGYGAQAKRDEVLDGLHVRPEARSLVPNVNLYTDDGRAAAEKWAAENEWALTVRRPRLPEIKLEDLPEPGAYGPDKAEMQRVLASVRPEDWRV
jgi:hypothetical protein